MKLAIMQPYAFPYLGYFQLAAAVDRFVLLDDVAFQRRGWINRNRILDPADGEPKRFTIPLCKVSRDRPICEMQIDAGPRWRRKLVRQIERSYAKAPQFGAVWPMFERLLSDPELRLSVFIRNSLTTLFAHLGIDISLADPPPAGDLGGEERIIEICRQAGATDYINLEGGRAIYVPEHFAAAGIRLQFLEHRELPYPQFGSTFVPRLSIIDAIMFNDQEQLQPLLGGYTLAP